MMLATLCCMIVALVKTWRLNTAKSHSSLDKPDGNMSMFFTLLVPQFMLLGIIDGVFEQSVAGFFKNQVPPTASVFVVGKIIQLGGKPSWFQDTYPKQESIGQVLLDIDGYGFCQPRILYWGGISVQVQGFIRV
ncbi:hypothetical protein V6N13_149158 [Hibiscus sabdariffa]|uniref:Uncharacterized protein n=1 Tax=Hibiscus sabdariffa TaxID=183260 RepID=A0ABR2EI60_9ROSI